MKNILPFFLVLAWLQPAVAQYNWRALPAAPQSPRCDDMYFLTPSLGWVINPAYPAGPWGRVYKTTDGGETWIKQLDEAPVYFRSVGFADENTGWVGSLYAPSDTFLLRETTDGGTTWHSANLPTAHPAGICGISVVNDTVVFAYGRFYGPAGYLKTTNKGATWTYKDMTSYAGGFIDGYFYDQDTGFITGRSHDEKPMILSTHDGGNTWDTCYLSTRPDSGAVWKIVFPGDGAVGYASIQAWTDKWWDYDNWLLKTTDRGRTWMELPFIHNYDEEGIGFINDSVGWIGGSYNPPYNYKTMDGGLTWSVDTGFGVLTMYNSGTNAFSTGFAVNRFRRFGDTLMYASGKTIYKLNTRDKTAVEIVNPASLELANYPNPFREKTTIRVSLPAPAKDVILDVWDAKGAKMFSRHIGAMNKGLNLYIFQEPLPKGVFYYSVRTKDYTGTMSMIVDR